MGKRSGGSYISIIIQSILGLLLFWNLIISVYAVVSPDKVKRKKISDLTYGPVKISGEIKGASYGQVNFSTVNLNDGSGSVTILFGLYKNIEDPVKVKKRNDIKNVDGMSREEALKKLNAPLHYDSIEIIGIYYPFLKLVHAYYINDSITVVEFMMISMYFVLAAFFFYSVLVTLVTDPDEK